MSKRKTFIELFVGWLVALLAALTIASIFSWGHTQYIAYTFFISWGLLFLFYIITLKNLYILVMLGLAAGALGMLFSLLYGVDTTKTQAALLLGKITLTAFTALLGYRVFKNKGQLENNTLFVVLLGLLVFKILIQTGNQVDALSVGGFVNYFTVGVIANILLNGHYNNALKNGEKAALTVITISSLYNIAIMLIANFL